MPGTHDYDVDHPALRIGWWFMEPYSEKAIYKGHVLVVQHRGHDHCGYPTVNLGFIDGRHYCNDASFQRLVIRLVEQADTMGEKW